VKILQRTALLPYSADKVYGIVNDVARYPEFLPWCKGATVLERAPQRMVATLVVEASGFSERITTSNALTPGERIELRLMNGPFSRFEGQWRLSPVGGEQGCRVGLQVRFAFRGALRLLHLTQAGNFTGMADAVMNAFCRRAHDLLGADA